MLGSRSDNRNVLCCMIQFVLRKCFFTEKQKVGVVRLSVREIGPSMTSFFVCVVLPRMIIPLIVLFDYVVCVSVSIL
jgi:hypothetical protein